MDRCVVTTDGNASERMHRPLWIQTAGMVGSCRVSRSCEGTPTRDGMPALDTSAYPTVHGPAHCYVQGQRVSFSPSSLTPSHDQSDDINL